LANEAIFAMLAELFGGRGNGLFGGVAMRLLRFIAVALVAVSMAVWFGAAAVAEPLDRDSCLKLQGDRQKLLTREMQAALDRGPDWVKDHLNSDEIEKVRQFLDVEAMIEFRCRNGGVVKPSETAATSDPDVPPLPDRKPAPPPSDVAAGDPDTPLPERKPGSSPPATADVNASQTVADSDKTAPPKTKATR
jgi:hypothetical protein